MGWLNSERPPERYERAFIRMMVERIRTAVNFMDDSNFPNGVSGHLLRGSVAGNLLTGNVSGNLLNARSVTFQKVSSMEFEKVLVALAVPHVITATALTTVSGLVTYNPLAAIGATIVFEVCGSSSASSATATFELHGASGLLASVSTTATAFTSIRSAAFPAPPEGQTMLVRARTSHAGQSAGLLSARIVITT